MSEQIGTSPKKPRGISKYEKYKQAAAAVLRHDGQIQTKMLGGEQILASSNLLPDDEFRSTFDGVGDDILSNAETLKIAEAILGGPKKTRGRNKSTIKLIDAMYKIAENSHPISGRGIGYKLFTAGLIPSMSKRDMGKVYRALVRARMDGTIPWDWIVDETREIELVGLWDNPRRFANGIFYRRDLWQTQEHRVEVWCEKGTFAVLEPVLAELGVGFRVMHGFASATAVWDAANNYNDGRPLIVLYVGDFDPSGMCMSEVDLPARIKEFGGDHIEFRRIALTEDHITSLQSFPASDKKDDKRYDWFVRTYGDRAFELDAMDPVVLRDLVKAEIEVLIDRPLWEEQERLQAREKKVT